MLFEVGKFRPARETDRLGGERALIVQAHLRAAHGKRAAGTGDRRFMLATGGFDVVARPAILHAQIRRELSVIADRLQHFDRAQPIECDRLIRRNGESHRAARPGAELGVFADFHAFGRFLPGGVFIGADLHEPFDAGDGCLEMFCRGRGLRCLGEGTQRQGTQSTVVMRSDSWHPQLRAFTREQPGWKPGMIGPHRASRSPGSRRDCHADSPRHAL